MVWYMDDTVKPIGVLAPNRSTARKIGDEARPDEIPTAVINEDEGADVPSDEKLSTTSNPHRFIEEVLTPPNTIS